MGVDISARALEAAQCNARAHGLDTRYHTLCSSWFEKVRGQFDLIVSNPPYIASAVIEDLDIDVRDHDPRIALDGGYDGLNAYGVIAAKAAPYLKKGGRIAVEIGFDQKMSVSKLFEAAGFVQISAANDLNGLNRALIFE
ncbi:MAG: methyltransferase [Ahrensia sp.]|nr:methyltransferase [Ahrensia sp.]